MDARRRRGVSAHVAVNRPADRSGGACSRARRKATRSTLASIAGLGGMKFPRFPKRGTAREPEVLIADPRVDDWETVGVFEDQTTAIAWRDQLRQMGVGAE